MVTEAFPVAPASTWPGYSHGAPPAPQPQPPRSEIPGDLWQWMTSDWAYGSCAQRLAPETLGYRLSLSSLQYYVGDIRERHLDHYTSVIMG